METNLGEEVGNDQVRDGYKANRDHALDKVQPLPSYERASVDLSQTVRQKAAESARKCGASKNVGQASGELLSSVGHCSRLLASSIRSCD